MASTEIQSQEKPLDAATMEQVVVNGDLSKLNPAQKIQWYRARCEAAGLDPRTQPFQFLSLQGRLTLYATKAATDQLIANRKLTVQILDRRHDPQSGIYEVQCRVTFPDGHFVEDVSALSVAGLKGDAMCNAVMKSVTKAKRRTVLSACGLGMLDESEIETIPGARRADEPTPDAHHAKNHDNATGHGVGAYADPEVVKQFALWMDEKCNEVNQKWFDFLTDEHGEIRKGSAEIISVWQLSGHLIKWGRVFMGLKAPEEIRAGSRDKYAAVLWQRDQTAVINEATEYCRHCWREAKAKLSASEHKPPNDDGDQVAAENAAMDALLTTEAGARG